MSPSFNALQLRSDLWHRLRGAAERIEKVSEVAQRKAHREDIGLLLQPLEMVEQYWAFPGRVGLEKIREHFTRAEDAELKRLVASIVRAITSESYRYRPAAELLVSGVAEPDHDDSNKQVLARFDRKPYFELLVVDALGLGDERAIKDGLRQSRGPEDSFVYETVVPSFEDAIIAFIFNYNIQAVVLRYSVDFKSKNRLDVLLRYLSGLDSEDMRLDDGEDISARLGCGDRRSPPGT